MVDDRRSGVLLARRGTVPFDDLVLYADIERRLDICNIAKRFFGNVAIVRGRWHSTNFKGVWLLQIAGRVTVVEEIHHGFS